MSQTTMPAHHKPNVPAAVRAQAKRAEDVFHAVAAAQAGEANGEVSDPAEGASSSPAPEPAAALPTGAEDASPTASGSPSPVSDQQRDAGDDAGPNVDWQHRYSSLKGKHDQMAANLASARAEVANLQRVIAGMQLAPTPVVNSQPEPAPAPAPSGDLHFRPITDEERAEYGEEFLSVAERAAAARFMPVISQLQTKIEQLERGVHGVTTSVAQDAHGKAMAYLQSEVPDWAQMDTDPGFLGWLNQVDPFSGQRRQDLLDNALAAHNGPRIVAFFKGYKESQAPSVTTQSPPASPEPPPTRRSRTSLETFAAPGRGRPGTPAGTPATTGQAPVFTQSQIVRFYEDVRKGVYRNNPAEKARIEADIFAATSAGRIMAG